MEYVHRSAVSRFILLIVFVLVLAACGGQPGAAPPSAATAAAPAPAQAAAAPTSLPAAAAAATSVPVATAAPTSVPTDAPAPTAVPTATPAPTEARPTEAPAPAEAAPTGSAGLDLLLNALRAQFAQKAWRTTVTIDDGGEVSTTMVEFVAPDSVHLTTGPGPEFIIMKEGTYQKGADGKWQKLPMDMSSMVANILDPAQVEDLMEDTTVDRVKFLGPDLIGGKPMWVYQYASKMNLGEQAIASDAKIWIGVLDKLPYRGESVGDSVTKAGNKVKSTVIYEYDSSIKIEAPIK